MKNRILSTLGMLFVACVAQADNSDSALKDVASNLRKTYSGTQIDDVRTTPISGIYEVDMGSNIGYTDAAAQFFIFGHLFDMRRQLDMTQVRMDEINAVKVSKLPLHDAIKSVHGKGQRELIVFSDPDCPYCKRLEKELEKLDNATIYTFPFPLDSLHPDAAQKAKSIWCSKNREKAWHEALVDDKQPQAKHDCDNPIARNVQLGQKLNINGTPTLISSDGRVMPGAGNIAEIEQWLQKKGGN